MHEDLPCAQALEGRGGAADRERAEKQLIALLALPLARPDAVAVLGLSAYPKVMALLAPTSRKARSAPLPLACICAVQLAAPSRLRLSVYPRAVALLALTCKACSCYPA